jgi:hypothetical protein
VVQLTRSRISEQHERKFAGNFTPDEVASRICLYTERLG